ncbi:MAG TPA: SagB/ThcOx family dehydrogenase [Planctomycetes bacterium]|nr:SagB/ThcOx family dehydrogenase [Planctomycetota bacterium]HIK62095.1 SagB/ThcOx family dehydrogenase [Planctomycetota bacterium]
MHAYHQQTKHGLHRYAAGPMGLDWANQPDPFRTWGGAERVPLEVVLPSDEPKYGPSLSRGMVPRHDLDRQSISRLFFDSFSLSAWKQAGEARWALRVNPSSGNLHPTEAYLLAPPIEGVSEHPVVAHYAPREHCLELRAQVPDELWGSLTLGLPAGSFFIALTSIHWREAWKYGERAYRYCQHDAGHGIAALAIAAGGMGWSVDLCDQIGTEDLARLVGVWAEEGPDAETPDCLLLVCPSGEGGILDASAAAAAAQFPALEWKGRSNDLSREHEEWDAIDLAARASVRPSGPDSHGEWERTPRTAPLPQETPGLRRIIRQRRSAVALDGKAGISARAFYGILENVMPRAGRVPFDTLPWSPRLHLAIFVHRVEGLEPGLYWLQRDEARKDALRAACRPEFLWARPADCPSDLPLSLLFPSDLKQTASQVSCNQDIAADGAFSLGMIADFDRSVEEGAWFYPRLFWEAGAIGQVLYLEAEVLGLRGTGIGCYFDDAVHSILALRDTTLQSLYHFTLGQPVEDERLTTLEPYE